MSSATHPTPPAAAPQPLPAATLLDDARWAAEIVPLLPPDYVAQATTLHAFHRIRGLRSPAALLRALLALVLVCSSFRHLGAWATLLDLAALSDTAWRNRRSAATDWLDWLLRHLIAVPTPPASPSGLRVLLLDGTIIRPRDRTLPNWRVHLAYDFTAGRLHSVELTDHYTAESLTRFALGPGALAVCDAGFARRAALAAVSARGAYWLTRFDPRTCPLERADGRPLALEAWLHSLRGHARSRRAYLRHKKQRVAVRVIALRLPEAKAAQARARKRRKAKTDGRQITEATLYLAGWVLLVTTLPAQAWSTEAVGRLYRGRWQIELLFKQLKQLIRLEGGRVRQRARAEAEVRATLVAWALGAKLAGQLTALLPRGSLERGRPVSRWAVARWGVEHLRAVVAGGWPLARVVSCREQLGRYLCSSPRRRRHQASELWAWLNQRQAAPPTLPAVD